MTDEEWGDLVVLIENWWPGDWSEQRSSAYRLALDRYPAAMLAKVLGNMAEGGEEFRPTVPDLLAALFALERSERRRLDPPKEMAGRNAPKLEVAWEDGARVVGIHRECRGELMEVTPGEERGKGLAPTIVQCERCLEMFGTRVALDGAPF